MEKEYIQINRKAYDTLADQYDDRTRLDMHEIKEDYWYSILNHIIKAEHTKVLEIGPGSGRNLKMFELLGCDTVAVELSREMSKVASKRAPKSKIINKNILECQFAPKSFEVIFLMAVIHNFPLEDAYKLMNKLYEWLSDDGYLLIGTSVHEEEYAGFLVKEDYRGNVSRFRYQFTKEAFEKLLTDNGFKIERGYIVNENIRQKKWYDVVCKKIDE